MTPCRDRSARHACNNAPDRSCWAEKPVNTPRIGASQLVGAVHAPSQTWVKPPSGEAPLAEQPGATVRCPPPERSGPSRLQQRLGPHGRSGSPVHRAPDRFRLGRGGCQYTSRPSRRVTPVRLITTHQTARSSTASGQPDAARRGGQTLGSRAQAVDNCWHVVGGRRYPQWVE